MDLLVFGHAGRSMIVFPTSMGAFFEYEDRGMVAALADKIDAGLVQLFCVATLDTESFYGNNRHPRERLARYLAYERYLVNDVVGLVSSMTGEGSAGVTGCSFG